LSTNKIYEIFNHVLRYCDFFTCQNTNEKKYNNNTIEKMFKKYINCTYFGTEPRFGGTSWSTTCGDRDKWGGDTGCSPFFCFFFRLALLLLLVLRFELLVLPLVLVLLLLVLLLSLLELLVRDLFFKMFCINFFFSFFFILALSFFISSFSFEAFFSFDDFFSFFFRFFSLTAGSDPTT
jgi:hypothetical protein